MEKNNLCGSMKKETSWKRSSSWYDSLVGEKGHYYHREVIIPGMLRLLQLKSGDSLLDIGCGQGVFQRAIPPGVAYVGMDSAKPMLQKAHSYSSKGRFECVDVTQPWPKLSEAPFTHAVAVLAIQNIAYPEHIFKELAPRLHGVFVVVMNHPCFRIPRQSRWGFDPATKTQTRELFSYMTPQEIPIYMHPGKDQEETWSFHRPLSSYVSMGRKYGFVIEAMEEWCSPKVSEGGAAARENKARKEFPLFLALVYRSIQA